MVVIGSFTLPLGDRDPDQTAAALREFAQRVAPLHPSIMGIRLERMDEAAIGVHIRVAGPERSHLLRKCRGMAAMLARAVLVNPRLLKARGTPITYYRAEQDPWLSLPDDF